MTDLRSRLVLAVVDALVLGDPLVDICVGKDQIRIVWGDDASGVSDGQSGLG